MAGRPSRPHRVAFKALDARGFVFFTHYREAAGPNEIAAHGPEVRTALSLVMGWTPGGESWAGPSGSAPCQITYSAISSSRPFGAGWGLGVSQAGAP